MKLALYLSFFLFTFLTFSGKTSSITDFQIKKICKKEKRELICIKNLRQKRSNLQKGDRIEIPVIPYESN